MVRIILFILLVAAPQVAWANDNNAPSFASVITVCPVNADVTSIPDGTGADCETLEWWRVDAQGRHVWLLATIDLSHETYISNKPLAVFVSAKASSEVFLNGAHLGANGVPAQSKEEETPGRMDAVFFAPREIVRNGENKLAIRMSSHHGFLKFSFPTHQIALGVYQPPTDYILRAYWPSFIPFGALIAGAIYFAATALTSRRAQSAVLLTLMSLFAAAQLFTEVFRGIDSYAYPVHEWRMLLIVAFSFGFGFLLAAHVTSEFFKKNWRLPLAGIVVATLAGIFLISGYDGKAGLAILVPASISALIALYAARQRKPQAILYFFALTVFCLTTVIYPSAFLDALFFYEVAGLMLALFAVEAIAIGRDRRELEEERARARQLEVSLERARNGDASQIKINSAGKIDIVPADQIAFCKGAGDYVEFNLKDGREILHNGSLAKLEAELPSTFLRVHRSYLVNTDYVRSLKREASGVGVLFLTNDQQIPVSRRIMPSVRSALT